MHFLEDDDVERDLMHTDFRPCTSQRIWDMRGMTTPDCAGGALPCPGAEVGVILPRAEKLFRAGLAAVRYTI